MVCGLVEILIVSSVSGSGCVLKPSGNRARAITDPVVKRRNRHDIHRYGQWNKGLSSEFYVGYPGSIYS